MKLSLSNLAFPAGLDGGALSALAEAGVAAIEVAPTRLGVWDALTPATVASFRSRLNDAGLSAASLQAILFGTDGLALLGDGEAFHLLAAHMRRVATIGAALGAGVAVFGSPRQRRRGAMPRGDAFALGTERLALLAELAHAEGLVIGLEPVPEAYGGDFLTTWQEVHMMVRTVDHPGLRVHLDTSCVMLGDGSISEAVRATASDLAHFHVAEPKLASFSVPVAEHAEAAAALAEIGYRGWLAIEMIEQPGDAMAAVQVAVAHARAVYAGVVGQ